MPFDGVLTDDEAGDDLLIAKAVGDELEHFHLTLGQFGKGIGGACALQLLIAAE